MDRTALVAQLAIEIIKQQIASGSKHPSPGLIKEAVTTAHGIVDKLDLDLAEHIEDRLGDELARRTVGALNAQASVLDGLASRVGALEAKATAPASPAPSVPSDAKP